MANTDAVADFINQNRSLTDVVDSYRGLSESDKHWQHRREFLLRNIARFPERDQLLALSMVWSNHVYSPALHERVTAMAEGIEVCDAPVFKTRDELMQKQKS
ncbi:hypothetical protein DNTS_012290 [Danionella cerebrum]|uniref:XRN2-binding (XTBD) domain-containing protein n=1 Tax=Danionella cerebrum TaxID=2873325 RepID=A0A553MX10_9TELE|nr:hypothetical protein DNTS_012290 [Danionella translucida]